MRRRNVERWRTIEARLGREATIWLVTVRPDDNPQMFPTWFVWLENKLYFVVATNSQQFENLRHNQGVSLALTDAERGVVIEGQAHASDRKAIAILADYFYNKYEFDFSQDKTEIRGITACGRATVECLRMNSVYQTTTRRYWVRAGLFPQPTEALRGNHE